MSALLTLPMNTETKIPEILTIKRENVLFEHILLHPYVTKSMLAYHFGYQDTRALARNIFTDEILSKIGMKRNSYKAVSAFTPTQTDKIYKVLNITFLRIRTIKKYRRKSLKE